MKIGKIIEENKFISSLLFVGVVGGGYMIYHNAKKNKRNKRKKILAGINITDIARNLGNNFGFEYSVIDPRSWSENDDEILKILKNIPVGLMPEVEKEYKVLYNRSLRSDCQKYLDDYNSISYVFRVSDIKDPNERARIAALELEKLLRSR